MNQDSSRYEMNLNGSLDKLEMKYNVINNKSVHY